jgi:hypothetical protein
MLIRQYVAAGHLNRVTINRVREGWDLREERDDQVVRRVNYTDWHRVERAIQAFELARPEGASAAHDERGVAGGLP